MNYLVHTKKDDLHFKYQFLVKRVHCPLTFTELKANTSGARSCLTFYHLEHEDI